MAILRAVHDDIARMAQHLAPRGGERLAGTAGELARPVLSVGSSMPVGELEVVFRSPDVGCVVVEDDADRRTGIITRAGLAAALTGRLGYGRAVLERRPASTVTDWSPLVVGPSTRVPDVATRAMARAGEHRYDDVLVTGRTWAAAGTADIMRSLVAALAERATHDPLTGLPSRQATRHNLARRCELVRGSGTRVVLVLFDVRDMAALNARHGQEAGDLVLAGLASRLQELLPRGCEAGRVEGDRFAVLATLPSLDDLHAAASAEMVHQHLLSGLATPAEHAGRQVWPALRSAVVWSVAGSADPDELMSTAEARLAQDAAPPVPDATTRV